MATLVGRPEIEDEVEGDSFQIHKFQGGGWAHHRYQHNAENKWIHNADNVAERIASLVRRLQPRFVLLAGDVRARQILTDRASDLWSELIVSMDEGGRAAGADREPVERRMHELVAEHEARECAEILEKVQAAGAHGLSVTGLDRVVRTSYALLGLVSFLTAGEDECRAWTITRGWGTIVRSAAPARPVAPTMAATAAADSTRAAPN